MKNMINIKLGDYIDLITDYHSNGSYKTLKDNVSLLDKKNYAVMIRTLNFEQNDFFDNLIYVDEHSYNYLEKSKVLPNDILMNKIANPGSVYLMPDLNEKVTCGMNLFLIRFNNKINQLYMYYNMKYNEEYIKGFAHGTTTKTITKDEVKNINLYIHPFEEQTKIASFFKSITDLLFNYKLIVRNLYNINEEIFNYNVLNDKQEEKLNKENIFEYNFPSNWKIMKLSDIISLEKGMSYKGSDLDESGIPMINLANFDINRNYKSSELKYLKTSSKITKKCKPGDMLIACTDLTRNADIIGSPILVNEEYDEYTFSMDLCKIKIEDKNVNPIYLYMWLNTKFYHNYIKGFATGTNVMHLNTDGILNYEIVLPSLEEQNMIVNGIKENLDTISIISIQEKKLNELFNEMIKLVMSGQVTINE